MVKSCGWSHQFIVFFFFFLFQQACGFEFTKRLNQMIKDTTRSADLNNKFQNYTNDGNFDLGIDFSIQVLQVGIF